MTLQLLVLVGLQQHLLVEHHLVFIVVLDVVVMAQFLVATALCEMDLFLNHLQFAGFAKKIFFFLNSLL